VPFICSTVCNIEYGRENIEQSTVFHWNSIRLDIIFRYTILIMKHYKIINDSQGTIEKSSATASPCAFNLRPCWAIEIQSSEFQFLLGPKSVRHTEGKEPPLLQSVMKFNAGSWSYPWKIQLECQWMRMDESTTRWIDVRNFWMSSEEKISQHFSPFNTTHITKNDI
jgi:hypothetical protein